MDAVGLTEPQSLTRLDGVPLALELAAARVDTLGVGGLTARLDDRFSVLTSGRRTALPRQQTLRATIDWSYDLLPEAEEVVLRCFAVFRGALTIAAAAAIVIDEQITATDAIEGIANLAEKSLISRISQEIPPTTAYSTRPGFTRWRSSLKAARSTAPGDGTPRIFAMPLDCRNRAPDQSYQTRS